MVNNIGQYFRSKLTFRIDDSTFKEGMEYQLVDVIEEEIFTLYIFKGGYIYGDYDNEFRNHFIQTEEDRIRALNKILYED